MRLGLPKGKGRELQMDPILVDPSLGVGCSTPGCATCPNNVCTSCRAGMLLNATNNTCVCQTGPMNSGGTGCTRCPWGTAFNVATQTCVTLNACPSGQYWTGTQCEACSAFCTSCAPLTGACSTCASPFVLSFGECVCPSG